jgi:hypothetical protein
MQSEKLKTGMRRIRNRLWIQTCLDQTIPGTRRLSSEAKTNSPRDSVRGGTWSVSGVSDDQHRN